ncbi:MAG: aldehyde dehydrogenase family protein [Pseudomonadota bacterium]
MFDTPESDLRATFDAMKAAFAAEPKRAYDKRMDDLDHLAKAILSRKDEIVSTVSDDFNGRSVAETILSEIGFVLTDIRHTRSQLKKWMKPKSVAVGMTTAPGKAYVRFEPLGVAGIVSPWNYPVQLALAPLVAALSAGCRVIIKPAEATPGTSDLLARIISDAFAPDHVKVVTGGRETGEAFTNLPFDRLFFTGSTQVGRIVAQAAAKNLTPVTLELGGKSPAVLGDDMPVEKQAEIVGFGKMFNAGQTCIAPDYVLAPEARVKPFAEAVMRWVGATYGETSVSSDYTSQISGQHYDRMAAMVEEAREKGAEILQSSTDLAKAKETRKFPLTIVLNPPADARMMQEEIFGPILPVLSYKSLDDATRRINEGERPLALYAVFKDKLKAREVLEKTISGGAGVNATLIHLSVAELPFGGVGQSGMGAYHGHRGFLEFTHQRSVFEAPTWHLHTKLAPPFGKLFDFVAKQATRY